MKPRRVVVTGIGLVTPVGNTTAETWDALLEGKSGAGPITYFDTEGWPVRIAAELKGFDPLQYIGPKEVRRMDLFIQYAIAATEQALQDSGLKITSENADRVGTFIGSGIGGLGTIEKQKMSFDMYGWKKISPFFIPSLIVNMASGRVSIQYGAKGPNSAVCTACSTGCHAIGDSFKIIQDGRADAMICGGTEGVVTPLAIGGFAAARAISTRNDEPEKASRPFDKDRDGFLMGEGCGIVILESYENAVNRGAKIYAEVVGYGMSGDAYHITSPSEDGDGPRRVMKCALEDAKLSPSEIDYINTHGTATPVGDPIEVRAIRETFGDHANKLVANATKSMIGHLLGAAGGAEIAVTALSIYHQTVHPTINLDTPDPACDLDFVPHKPRKMTINYALANSFGFGGTNAAVILKRFED